VSEAIKNLADAGAWVLHRATGTIGRAKVYYSGEGEDLFRPEAGKVTQGPVLRLDTGDAFCVKDDATFARLEDAEVRVYQVIQQAVTGTIGELAIFAASQKVTQHSFESMATSVLSRQLRGFAASKRG
jgi:hypothetical protein